MFGFSFAELIVVFLVALLFIKPQDLPEIAHFLGRVFYRAKKFFNEIKNQFKEVEKEFGIDELKQELNRGIAEEKSKSEDETTVIVDIYGNEHHIPNVKDIRSDLSKEELDKEIKKANLDNISSLKKEDNLN